MGTGGGLAENPPLGGRGTRGGLAENPPLGGRGTRGGWPKTPPLGAGAQVGTAPPGGVNPPLGQQGGLTPF